LFNDEGLHGGVCKGSSLTENHMGIELIWGKGKKVEHWGGKTLGRTRNWANGANKQSSGAKPLRK